jgi:hypothetical protein
MVVAWSGCNRPTTSHGGRLILDDLLSHEETREEDEDADKRYKRHSPAPSPLDVT